MGWASGGGLLREVYFVRRGVNNKNGFYQCEWIVVVRVRWGKDCFRRATAPLHPPPLPRVTVKARFCDGANESKFRRHHYPINRLKLYGVIE